ncbi:MAG: TetR/AcrR family transcriptional regulator [Chitinophagales bacterium]|nr:TetR/AcrR family transcriptional regulator [Chitinophagales bacterium]
MENNEKISTESKILAAAEQVFLRSGYDGSRMQEIADLAGINKALLHYYFRSKDALFEKIFEDKFSQFFPRLQEELNHATSFAEKVCLYAELHIGLLIKNPYLPHFVINTLQKNPDFAQKIPTEVLMQVLQTYYTDLEAQKVRELNPVQFMMSVMSMCVFPFLSKPLFCKAINLSDKDFELLMQARIEEVKRYIKVLLEPIG